MQTSVSLGLKTLRGELTCRDELDEQVTGSFGQDLQIRARGILLMFRAQIGESQRRPQAQLDAGGTSPMPIPVNHPAWRGVG